MKRLIYAEDSPKRFKVGDDNTNITVIPIELTDSVNTLVKISENANVRVLIRNKNTYITSITPVITDSEAVISSKKLMKMPAGEYFLELWVTTDEGTVVYPDRGFLPLFINENAEGETGEPITNVNADALRDELKQWVTEQLKTVQGSDIDLSNYFTKDEVTKLVDNNKVDLTPYLKTVDGDNKYLPKGTIVLDTNGRTLTVGNNTINIPNTVDLRGYAKADTVPNITYNSGTNTINLNGTDIKLSGNVDLSDYYTKEQVNDAINDHKVDLTPYLKTVDGDNKYLSKGTIVLDTNGRILTVGNNTINIPNTVDLSDYAKTDSVPSLSYDSQSNTLNLNGTPIKLGSTVDLSNYFNKEEVTNLINTSKDDLSPYLKIADANNNYLPKGSIVLDANARTLTVNGTVINIPRAVDLSDYVKKDSVPALTYNSQSNTLTLNGTDIKLGSDVDLSNFYTKSEIDNKLSQSGAGSGTNVNDVINKLGITQFTTNFSPTLDNDTVVTDFSEYTTSLVLDSHDDQYEYLTLVRNGTTDVNPGPSFDDLNNAQDVNSLIGLRLLHGYRWLTILSGTGFKEPTAFSFGSAWFFNSSLPYLSIRVVGYDTISKKYVAINKARLGDRLVRLLPLTSQTSEGDFNSGTHVRMYAAKDTNVNNWLVKDLVYKEYISNDWASSFTGLPLYQLINIMMTGNPDPQGSTNLVTFNGKDHQHDQVENNAPVTFFLTNLGGGEMKLGDQSLNPSTALVYQYPDKNTGQYELPIKLTSDSKSWLISCYKGRHLVPFLKQVDSDEQLRPINNSVDAFEPVYNGGPTNTQTEVTLYPFGIEPVHITFTK